MQEPLNEPVLSDKPTPALLPVLVDWRDLITVLVLAGLLAGGYWMRSVGRNWDDYTHLHPDERFLTDVASRTGVSPLNFPEAEQAQYQACLQKYTAPSDEELASMSEAERQRRLSQIGIGGYFDAQCSNLNPNNIGFGLYVYGQFPLFTTRVTAETVTEIEESQCLNRAETEEERSACQFQAQTSDWERYNGVHLIGRTVSSIADTLVILLVFMLGAKLVGRWPGLLAAGLYTFAAFPIQQSHFWTVDAFTGFWVMLTLYMAANVLDDDANLPARYNPLIWLATAFALWVWELPQLEEVTLLPLVVYGLAFAAAGISGTWANLRHFPLLVMPGIIAGVLLLGGALAVGLITSLGLIAAVIALIVIGGVSVAGMHRWLTYAGTLPWLVAPFGLWIYDSLANHLRPSLTGLALYLVIFTTSAILASLLSRTVKTGERVFWLVLIGVPLLIWMGLDTALGALTLEGMLVAVALAAMMIGATASGYRDYMGFGLAFGGALAGRVNIAPVVGVLLLAVIIRTLPVLDRRIFPTERYRLMTRAMMGVILAAIFTVLVFRFLQPHAFSGPSVIGLLPNPGWQDDIGEAQRLVSGDVDIPPNYQWANRIPWLYPWQNMTLWGMGAAMGLAAWGGVLWALWIIVRGQRGWTRLAIPAAWVLVYFGWLGGNWVTTMRYFLPLYGALAIFAGWMLLEIPKRLLASPYPLTSSPSWRGGGLRRVLAVASILSLLFVAGYTALYGYGMTAIYRHLLTRTAASIWFQENVPGNVGMWIEQADGQARLQNIDTGLASMPFYTVTLHEDEPFRTKLLTADNNNLYNARFNPNGYPALLVNPNVVQSVVLHRVGDPERDAEEETIRVRLVRGGTTEGEVIAERTLTMDFGLGYSDFGGEYSIRFDDLLDPVLLEVRDPFTGMFASYDLEITVLSGGSVVLTRNVADNLLPITLDHVSVYLQDTITQTQSIEGLTLDDPVESDATAYTYYLPSIPSLQSFTARATGTIREVVIPNVGDPLHDVDEETLRVQVTGSNGEISYGQITHNFLKRDDGFHAHGQRVAIPLDPPLDVVEGQTYNLSIAADQPLTTLGTVLATEGDWDDSIPYNACPLPNDTRLTLDTQSGYTNPQCIAFSPYPYFYKGIELYIAAEDDPVKRDLVIEGLDEAEYLTISSNRFYDAMPRVPGRWPFLDEYYAALFDGRLGFELVMEWTSYPRVGPFEWKDQVLPTDDLPGWLNEFESEEAFTVYDHPAVLIFRKTEHYDPERVRDILMSVPLRQYKEGYGGGPLADPELVGRNIIMAPDAATAPTGLFMPDEVAAANRQGGTWRELFSPGKLINENQVVAVVTWWLLMLVMGWLTFPILYAFFPALVDRGYATSKLAGWILVAWLAWLGGSMRLGTWSSDGILLCIGVLVAISAGFTWLHRDALSAFIRLRWRHLLALEGLTLLLFLIFLGVRLGNPDLWHNAFGGEKPMNFAYFNAVLRSEVFPPYDPWFAGGYINYYYWGYVLVGAPVKLIGLTPSVAYNIIIPTLFAMTGMGAFSIAYNLVAARKTMSVSRLMPAGSPVIAGIAALLLVTVMGNLDTPRVFLEGVADVGENANSGFAAGRLVPGWVKTRFDERVEAFKAANGRDPDPVEQLNLLAEVENADDYGRAEQIADTVQNFSTGLERVLDGDPLQMHTHRWYWMPTRIIGELPDGKGHNAIAEFPYFTFLYGDLHAHMIAMPVMLLALLWLAAEVLGAGRNLRGWGAAAGSLFFGGLLVGLLRAINTWDWPTYTILGIAGLTFAAWLTQKHQREGVDPLPLYFHLREYLDARRALRLWWVVWAFPAGLLLHALVWLIRSRTYQAELEAGLIPFPCQSLDGSTLKYDQIPEACRGLLEPHWSLTGSLAWGIGALIAVGFIYLALLIFFGARFERRGLLAWIGRVLAFLLISIVTVFPFTYYNAGEAGLKPWEYERTPLWAFLDIHGLFLFLIFSYLVWQTARYLKAYRVEDVYGYSLPFMGLLLLVPTVIIAAIAIGLFSVPAMLVTLPLIAWATILFLVPGTGSTERMVYALIVLALGIATGVEIVAITVDNGRQNIVFKFYMQIWLMFGVVGGVIIAWLLDALPNWRPTLRGAWQSLLALLVSIAFLYPIMATQARWLDRFNAADTPTTLDGLAYMPHAVYGQNNIWYNLIADYRMIQWLQENVEGTPTIIEAQGVEYQWGSRIAINTGLPTVMGWRFHQSQQRNLANMNNMLWTRVNNVHAFYTMPDIAMTMRLIKHYGIEYIVLGTVERVLYNDLLENPETGALVSGMNPGFAKFDTMVELGLLEVAYEAPNCIIGSAIVPEDCNPNRLVLDRIYRVVPGAEYRVQSAGGG